MIYSKYNIDKCTIKYCFMSPQYELAINKTTQLKANSVKLTNSNRGNIAINTISKYHHILLSYSIFYVKNMQNLLPLLALTCVERSLHIFLHQFLQQPMSTCYNLVTGKQQKHLWFSPWYRYLAPDVLDPDVATSLQQLP